MSKKEKYKLLLEEELIDQAEYDLLMSIADDDEPQEAEVEAEEEQGSEESTEIQEPEMEAEQVAEQEVDEVVEESIDNTEAEKVEPQVNGSEAQIQALTNKVEELEKVNTAMVSRLEVLEQTLSKLAVEAPPSEDFGISGTGKTTQGVNEAKNEQKNLYKAMGFRG